MVPSTPTQTPASGPSRARGVPWVWAGAGLVAVLAAVGLMWRGGDDAQAPAAVAAPVKATQSRGSQGGSTGGGAMAAGVEEAEAAERRFSDQTCFPELARFNDGVTLETFRDWAAPLLASKDPLVRDYLKSKLAELIGDDAKKAGQVVDWARDAQGAAFQVLLSGLRESDAVQKPQVAARLLEAGLDKGLPIERRAGMLSALDTQKHLTPDAMDRMAEFARDPASTEAGWAATRTLGRVMARESENLGDASPYLDRLITIATDAPDEQIRHLAQTAPLHNSPVLDAKATARFERILRSEGNEDGRDAAAQVLAMSSDKENVLKTFTDAFQREQSVCVRWALFRFSARVAGRDALPVMANMATVDPRFQPLYGIFETLYAQGNVDFIRVWNELPDQNPFGCMDRHN
ncbi:hypothetical protein D7Y15_13680 [Corallococcus sp. AB030]|nr:hypothetical protein [Corallococcus exiguus]RKH28363.1 hypothetical protein D7V77_09165 [Corallococcus sp. CA041A]RKI15487.1 hypothetical protein D7Y15_13680 [Corallococcus sp. AB030]RUO90267.1 hypothetical protein D7Y11_26020 [Corallococcus sp. AB018]